MGKLLRKWFGCASADHSHEEFGTIENKLSELNNKIAEFQQQISNIPSDNNHNDYVTQSQLDSFVDKLETVQNNFNEKIIELSEHLTKYIEIHQKEVEEMKEQIAEPVEENTKPVEETV